MKPRFALRQAAFAALTANAIRPPPGFRSGIPAFFAGWLTDELAPHLLGAATADLAGQVLRRRASTPGLLIAGANIAGLIYLVVRSRRSHLEASTAMLEALGPDHESVLDPPTPEDERLPVLDLASPFSYGRQRRRLGVTVQRDIPYGDHPTRNLLDVYTSTVTPDAGAPVLVQVHGGGWTIGTKEQQALPLMTRMAAEGWVCVSINYRLAPTYPWPAQIIDVKRALAWVKEHIAEYGGDPSYVVITGGSAGGHLSSLAALTPNAPEWQPGIEGADTTVQAAVPHYGVYDFAGATGLRSAELLRDRFLAPRILQRDPAADREVFEAASPLLRITPDAPDFFVVHGAHDTLVPVDQARIFIRRLREVSRRSAAYAELGGAQHAFDLFPSIRSTHLLRTVDRYLTWHHRTWQAARLNAGQSGSGQAR